RLAERYSAWHRRTLSRRDRWHGARQSGRQSCPVEYRAASACAQFKIKTERSQDLQHLSNFGRWLAVLKIGNEAAADTSQVCELLLRIAFCFAALGHCSSKLLRGADRNA